MKITKLPTQRQNISIELTPDEQDILCSVMGSIVGGGPIRKFTNDLYHTLLGVGADHSNYPTGRSLDTGVE